MDQQHQNSEIRGVELLRAKRCSGETLSFLGGRERATARRAKDESPPTPTPRAMPRKLGMASLPFVGGFFILKEEFYCPW